MPARVNLDRTQFQRVLSQPGGMGDRYLRRKAGQVQDLAVRYATGHGSIPEGIIVGPVVDKSIKVISTNIHSVLVHNGSRRHFIRPRREGGWLRFEVGGRVVFARQVDHPGYRGDPFLTTALRDAF